MSSALKTRPDTELPDPSAVLVLWRVSMQCFVAISGRRKGERFLRLMAERLDQEESLSSVFHIRPGPEQDAVRLARRQAAEVYRRYLPTFLAGLSDD